jgi:hypothetical protein
LVIGAVGEIKGQGYGRMASSETDGAFESVALWLWARGGRVSVGYRRVGRSMTGVKEGVWNVVLARLETL